MRLLQPALMDYGNFFLRYDNDRDMHTLATQAAPSFWDKVKDGFDALRQQFEVNAIGPLRVTHALLPNLHDGSKVAIITSRMGSIADNGSGGYYGYRASKAAVNAIGKSLAVDLAPRGVSVYLLHPGYVATDMVDGHGDITPAVAAQRLVGVVDGLDLERSGTFWHSNGSELPW